MRSMTLGLVVLCVCVLGCDPPPTSIPPGEAQQVSAAPPPAPEPPRQPINAMPDAGTVAPEPEPPAGKPSRPAGGGAPKPRPLAAVGGACDTAADCDSGVCEGEGCAPGRGRCVAKNRTCTRDRRVYCGCDGNTFFSSGSCPGRRFSGRAACTGGGGALAADGAACKTAADCQSGVCEGEGCGDATSGVCVSRKRPCTADLRAYCGCDGVTFRASSSCAGRRYASRQECKK